MNRRELLKIAASLTVMSTSDVLKACCVTGSPRTFDAMSIVDAMIIKHSPDPLKERLIEDKQFLKGALRIVRKKDLGIRSVVIRDHGSHATGDDTSGQYSAWFTEMHIVTCPKGSRHNLLDEKLLKEFKYG